MILAGLVASLTLFAGDAPQPPPPTPPPAPTAPTAPNASGALSPDDAVKLALDRSGAVAAAKLGAEKAKLERGLSFAPVGLRIGHGSLDGFVAGPHTDNNGNPYAPLDDTYAALEWKLPRPAQLVDVAAEDQAAKADYLDVIDRQRDLAADVRTLHAQVLALRAEQALAKNALDIAQQLEKQTQRRLTAEAATTLDMRLVALRRLDAAADVDDVSSEADRAEHRLASLVGLPAPLSLAPPAKALCSGGGDDVNTLVGRALAQSERLQALAARRDRAKLQSSLAWAAWLPYVDGFLVGWYNEPLDKRDTVRGRVDIALPFFEPFSGNARASAIEQERLDALYADAAASLEADVRSSAERFTGAAALVKLYEESQQSIVDEGLADVQRALDAGEADVMRVAEVQARAVSAQRGLVHARARCEAAAIELMRFTGDVTGK